MSELEIKSAPFREVTFAPVDVAQIARPDGAILLKSRLELQPHPTRMTERLVHWARVRPDRVFLAQRDEKGAWRKFTYLQTLNSVKRIAQWLLQQGVSAERPLAILSENSLEHALLSLAALHIGIPYSPVSPMYSLKSNDFGKLKHVVRLLSPGLLFVSDGKKYEPALRAVANDAKVVVVRNQPADFSVTFFSELLEEEATPAVDEAFNGVRPATIAKILYTSGSTGLPKGVVNTHENICANWQQITQTFPFMADDFEIVDWLPWNHTFGGNHNFGLTLYNGGSMHLDDGNPTPAGIAATIENLREISPTIYFNVPKGFEQIVHYLRQEKSLRQTFFRRLQMLFYAGAGMPQHVWDALDELAVDTFGERIVIGTGLGCTESSPSALFANRFDGFSGLLGTPVPGLELKLALVDGKLEARYKGVNIAPGYWRQPERTAAAFDEEGFYRTGDALKFVDPSDANAGMLFDGRIDENFKLNSGSWVSVGPLRAHLIEASQGLIQDAVITGQDEDFVGAIVFPDLNYCQKAFGQTNGAALSEIVRKPAALECLRETLERLAKKSTGSTTFVRRAVFGDFKLSLDAGEVTDKGTINQRTVLSNYPQWVKLLHAEELAPQVVDIEIP